MVKIRVLLADDHAVLRAGLRMLIDAQPDMEVVGEAADGEEAVRRAAQTRPDVALMDITMPGTSGIQALVQVRERSPGTRVLVLTMHDDPAYVRAVAAAGGAGHVIKEVEGTELVSAIRAVHRGRRFVDLSPTGRATEDVLRDEKIHGQMLRSRRTWLSRRERRVLELVARGYTSLVIAGRLSLSVKTVETYRARLREKLGLTTRADLVRFALETGVLAPGKPTRPEAAR